MWNRDLDAELKHHGMIQSKYDPCLYTRRTDQGWMIMVPWVDDCVGACWLIQIFGGGAFWRCRWVPARVINAPPLGGALGRVPGTRPNAPNGEP